MAGQEVNSADQRLRAMAPILNQDRRFETSEHPLAINALSYDLKMARVASIVQVVVEVLHSKKNKVLPSSFFGSFRFSEIRNRVTTKKDQIVRGATSRRTPIFRSRSFQVLFGPSRY